MDWDTFWQLVIVVTLLQIITFIGTRLLLALVLREVFIRLDDLEARVAALEAETPEPPEPPFVIGETYPDETTVGAGIIRPYPTNVVNTMTVFEGTPRLVVDTLFNDLVQVRGDGWEFENCAFRGPVVRTSGSQIVWVDQARVTPAGKPIFRYCDINPQTASPYWNGIGWKLYRLEMCHVWGSTDGLAIFARSDDPDPRVYVEALGTWVEKLSQFKPDINRDVTHNDCAQLQGNKGPADDVFFDGCRLDGYHSVEQSKPTPPEHTQISAIMLSPNQQDRVCITIRRSWLTGGVFTCNGSASSLANSILVLEDNIWEFPNQAQGGPSAAIALNRVLTNRTLSGNVYPDGTPVPVYQTG